MGVDGCKDGWCAVCLDDGKCDVVVFRSFTELWVAHSDAALVLVDIPIGLPSKKTPFRMADSLARKILGRRHACVFSPGVREVHDCHTYAQACEINRQLIDKKISVQYWGIVPKIREVDRFLLLNPSALGSIREAHPEVCFEKASAVSVKYSKKTPGGIRERLNIIKQYVPDGESVYNAALKAYPRSVVGRDDIVDAMMLAVTGMASKGDLQSLPSPLERDEENMPMAIWYYELTR